MPFIFASTFLPIHKMILLFQNLDLHIFQFDKNHLNIVPTVNLNTPKQM